MRSWCLKNDEWSKDRILLYLKRLDTRGYCICEKKLNQDNLFLLESLRKHFNSLKNAMVRADLDYSEHQNLEKEIASKYPDENVIKEKILKMKSENISLTAYFVQKQMKVFYTAAIGHYGTWENAVEQSGIKYCTVSDKTFRSKGRYFQDVVREILCLAEFDLGKPSQDENPEHKMPDYFDKNTGTWIDAKLHPWSYGIEKTIDNYLKWAKSLWIIYLNGDDISLREMNTNYPTVKFICVDEYYDNLRKNGREDIIDELESLKLANSHSEKFKEFREKMKGNRKVKAQIAKKEEYQNQTSGTIGSIKPTIFIDKNDQAGINPDLMDDEIYLPWNLSREWFKDLAQKMVQEIFDENRKFFENEQEDSITYLDPEKFLDLAEKKYGQKSQAKAETIFSISYRISFAYKGRVYFAKHFVRTDKSVKAEIKKTEIITQMKTIIATNMGKRPISDEQIRKALSVKGYTIARRTVAKYRKEAGLSRKKENKLSLVEDMALSLLKAMKTDSLEYIPAMIEGLRYENKQIQKYCYLALKQMKESAFSALFEILQKKDTKLLPTIILLLAAIGPAAESSIEELKKLLDNSNQKVSSLAVYAIQKIKPMV
jgi:hypothetical protein